MTTTSTSKKGVTPAAANGNGKAKGKHITWKGTKFFFAPEWQDEPPGDFVFSIENNEASAAVQELFGDEQYVEIREKCKAERLGMRATFVELRTILDLCFKQWDLTAGES